MDTICPALCSDSVLDMMHRSEVEHRLEQVGRLLSGTFADQRGGPIILVVVTDESRLAARLGVPELPGSVGQSADNVIDGYVLDGLRLRELLGRHLSAPPGPLMTALCGARPGGHDCLAGMRSWTAVLR